jgi:hypothetical protein
VIGATSMREELASRGSTASDRRDGLGGDALLDYTRPALPPLHDGPLVEWPEVLEVMADPN